MIDLTKRKFAQRVAFARVSGETLEDRFLDTLLFLTIGCPLWNPTAHRAQASSSKVGEVQLRREQICGICMPNSTGFSRRSVTARREVRRRVADGSERFLTGVSAGERATSADRRGWDSDADALVAILNPCLFGASGPPPVEAGLAGAWQAAAVQWGQRQERTRAEVHRRHALFLCRGIRRASSRGVRIAWIGGSATEERRTAFNARNGQQPTQPASESRVECAKFAHCCTATALSALALCASSVGLKTSGASQPTSSDRMPACLLHFFAASHQHRPYPAALERTAA